MSDNAPESGFEPRIGRSVSIDHAAELLGVSRRTIYNRIRDGRLQTLRTIGGSQRVLLESLTDMGGRLPERGLQHGHAGDAESKSGKNRHSAFVTAVVALFLLAVSIRPTAAQHHARISDDLAEHLAAGSPKIDVIVHGDAQTVATLARRYNLIIRRDMRSGAVLQVNASQLAALREDEGLDHLSGDIRIQSLADVTAESIGADQVWAGAGDLKPLSGKGVSVAVIDSGIDTTHGALANRVIASVDFTGGNGMDRYGHGTHVASIIAGRRGPTPETRDYRGIGYGA